MCWCNIFYSFFFFFGRIQKSWFILCLISSWIIVFGDKVSCIIRMQLMCILVGYYLFTPGKLRFQITLRKICTSLQLLRLAGFQGSKDLLSRVQNN